MKLPAASFSEAVAALEFMFGWSGGFMPVDLRAQRLTFWHKTGIPGSAARLARVVRWHDEQLDTEIRLGVPWRHPSAGGVAETTCAWVRITGSEQLARAKRFRPLPSMNLQEGAGSTRLLVWSLERPVPWPHAREINRRLAYKFGAIQKHGDPDLLWIPAPGTCLREGRSRPSPVRVTRLTPATFMPEVFNVSRWLRDPPEQTWMNG